MTAQESLEHGYALHVIVPPEVRGNLREMQKFTVFMARRALETDPSIDTFTITSASLAVFETPAEAAAQPGLDHCDGCREGATRLIEFLEANPGEQAAIIDIVYETP